MPTREGYTFLYWYKGDTIYDFNDIVTEDFTLVAIWEANEYEITWIVDEESHVELHKYDTLPEFKGDTSKESDNIYNYEFIGWDKEVSKVTGDVTYTAQYKKTYIEYEIKFVNEDGTLISSEKYHYGDKIVLPSNPSKEATAQYTYTFNGWDKEVSMVTGDVTYTAQYKKTYIEYEIKFVDEDGTLISSEKYHYGDKVVLPSNPSKEATTQYTYTFSGWDKEVVDVVSSTTYKATYSSVINRYKITFLDEYGIVSSYDEVLYGEKVEVPQEPQKNNYIFLGWFVGESKYDFNTIITGELVLKMKWKEIIDIDINDLVDSSFDTISNQASVDKFIATKKDNKITVSIVDKSMNSISALAGTGVATAAIDLLKSEGIKEVIISIPGGSSIVVSRYNINEQLGAIEDLFFELVGNENSKIDSLIGDYIDIEIIPEYGYKALNGNAFVVEFTTEVDIDEFIDNSYTTILNSNNGEKLKVYRNNNAIKVDIYKKNMHSIEVLSGVGFISVIRDLIIENSIEKIIISVPNGNVLIISSENFDSKISELEDLFMDLSADFNAGGLIGKSLNIELVLRNGYYTKDDSWFTILFAEPESYQISFNTLGGSYIAPQLVYYKNNINQPVVPVKEGYTFKYWSYNGELYNFSDLVVSDMELIAVWEINKYKVIFKDSNGAILSEKIYDFGERVEIPSKPTKDSNSLYSYTFKNWDKEVTIVKNDVVYTAVYETILNTSTLVNNSYDIINNQVSTDKFELEKDGNTIEVIIKDLNMNSVQALAGTGIATAATNLLTTEGVKEVTITIPGGSSLTISADTLADQLDELEDLFFELAGSNAISKSLIGKSIRITIVLKDGYKANGDPTFAITFTSKINANSIKEDFYNSINSNTSNLYDSSISSTDIVVTVLDTQNNIVSFVENTNIFEYIEEMLLVPGINSITLLNLETNRKINIKIDDFSNNRELISSFVDLLGIKESEVSGNLGGKNLQIILNNDSGYLFIGESKFTVTYDAIYTIDYNVDGNKTSVKVDYNDYLDEPTIPTKAGYTFLHWELNGEKYEFNKPVTSDMELVAIWNINKYEINFISNNNEYGLLNKTSIVVDYGTKITISNNQLIIGEEVVMAIPTIANTQYTYYFKEWSNVPTNSLVEEDITIEALFYNYVNEYEVEWIVEGVSTKETYKYGEQPNFKGNTDKSADMTYTYEFIGWDKEISIVTGDVTYTAQYKATYIEYEVKWIVDGVTIKENYHYGEQPSFKGNANKLADMTYTYEFAGWDKEVSIVTEDVTYTAQYKKTYIEYEIEFVDEDGTLISSEKYHYGDKVVVPTNPSKEATAQYTYTFSGWDKEVVDVVGSTTYKATYSSVVNEYKVSWRTAKGGLTETYKYGKMPTFTLDVSKDADNTYTYEFIGWDKEISIVTGDVTYIAQYKETYIEYEVEWIVDGLKTTENYHYNETPSFKGSTIKAADKTYTYEFDGWDKEVSMVTGDVTYTAQYNPIYIEYEIGFADDEGRVVCGGYYHYGDVVDIPSAPNKESTAQYTYVFSGWDKEVSIVTGNIIYYATYTPILNEYKVSWRTAKGGLTETYKYGKMPTFTLDVSKDADNTYTYEFIGWDKEISIVTGDVTYTAQYKKTYIEYEIKFVDEDETLISSEKYHYGDKVVVPTNPSKEATAQYTYTFAGWDKEVVDVVDNTTYKATYSSVVNEYQVSWRTAKGGLTETYKYGEMPTFTLDVSKDADNTYTYEFIGWDKEISIVTGDVTYTAQYKKTYIEYEIKFVDEDGTLISSEKYHYGDNVVVPTDPSKESTAQYTYTFSGWDKEVVDVVSTTTYKATYSSVVNEYEVEWIVEGVSTKETYKYGEMPNFKGNTKKLADNTYTYEFVGWDKEVSMVTNEVTYTAKFNSIYIEYEIKWIVDGVTTTENYYYDEMPNFKGSTSKEADKTYTYEFAGWDKEVSIVTGDVTYIAKYNPVYIEYEIKFVDEDGILISSEKYHYGDKVVLPSNPSKEATAQYTYKFSGWDKEVVDVVSSTTYKATYSSVVNEYEVEWIVEGVSTKETYKYGEMPNFKGNTKKLADNTYTYEFVGWDKEVSMVTGEVTYTAKFNPIYIEYKVEWIVDGLKTTENYHYNETPSFKGSTIKAADKTYTYEFAGWDKAVAKVTGNVTYTAQYNKTYIEYEVKFVDEDESLISSTMYHYGDTVIVPSNPSKESTTDYTYEFAGWDKEITIVNSNVVYKAKYNTYMDVNSVLNKDLDTYVNSKNFTISPVGDSNDVVVKFASTSKRVSGLFSEVVAMFRGLSANENYESVVLHTIYPDSSKDKSPNHAGYSVDLKGEGVDLTKDSLVWHMSWWTNGGGNDEIGNWTGYLLSGTRGTGQVLNKYTSDAIGKVVTVTVTLKEGTYNTDGSNVIKYTLTFTS